MVSEQTVSPGGEHVAEIARAAAATGRKDGYITRRLSESAVFGCTCGEWFDGPADEASSRFQAHVTSDAFQPVDG